MNQLNEPLKVTCSHPANVPIL